MYAIVVGLLVVSGVVGVIGGVCTLACFFDYDEQKSQNPSRAAVSLREGRIAAMVFIGCVAAFVSMWPLLEYTGSEEYAPTKLTVNLDEFNTYTLKQFQKNTALVQQQIEKNKKVKEKTSPKYRACLWLLEHSGNMNVLAKAGCMKIVKEFLAPYLHGTSLDPATGLPEVIP